MAGVMQSGRGGRSGIVGINVTPMVDVVLVLLVIMMVSATYIVSQALKVELPKSASTDETVSTVVQVTVTKENKVFFNQLGSGQDKAAMANVMVGIAEALVATGIGLFVAIPAVVAYNIFQRKVTDVEDNVSAVGKQLGAILRAVHHVEHVHAPLPAKTESRASVRAAADPELAS